MMTRCPHCHAEWSAATPSCPQCGYAPPAEPPDGLDRLLHSSLADLALIIGALVAGLGAFGGLANAAMSIVDSFARWQFDAAHLKEAAGGGYTFLLSFGMVVVFLRLLRRPTG